MKRSSSSFQRKKPKRRRLKAKKLRPSICHQLLKYTAPLHSLKRKSDNFQLLYSLVSTKYHQQIKQFNNGDVSIAVDFMMNYDEESDYENGISVMKHPYLAIISNNNFENVLSLLKMAEFPILKFRILDGPEPINIRNISQDSFAKFANFCRRLKEIEPIKKLFITFEQYDRFSRLLPAFLELLILSNKQIFLKSPYFNVLSCFKNNDIALDSWKIRGLLFENCTSQIFKANVKHLILTKKRSWVDGFLKLHHLKKFGPFPFNSHLEHIEIYVDLMHFDFDIGGENKLSSDHMKTFQFLKQLNPNLTSTLSSLESKTIKFANDGVIFYEEQVNRAKKVIDMAHEFGFEVKNLFAEITLRPIRNVNVFYFMRDFIETTNLKSLIELEYKGAKITVHFIYGTPIN